MKTYETYSLDELRDEAKRKKVPGFSKMRKSQLVQYLSDKNTKNYEETSDAEEMETFYDVVNKWINKIERNIERIKHTNSKFEDLYDLSNEDEKVFVDQLKHIALKLFELNFSMNHKLEFG